MFQNFSNPVGSSSQDVTLFYDYCDDPVTKEIRGTALMDAMDDPFANDEDWTDVF